MSGTIATVPVSALCSGSTWTSSGVDLSFLADGPYTISLTHENASANTTSASSPVTKDTSVNLPTLSFQNPVNGYGNFGSTTIRVGDIASGDDIDVYSDASCSTLLSSQTSSGAFHDISLSTGASGTYSFYFIITDSAPSSTPCLGPKTHTEDTIAPPGPTTITMSSPANASTSNDSTPLFSGMIDAAEEGSTVEIFRDASCSELIGSDTVNNGAFSVLASLAVDGSHNGLNSFYSKITDQAGNTSSCASSSLSYTLEGAGLATLPKIAMVGADSPSSLVSLEDGNEIIWIRKSNPGSPINLGIVNAGEVIAIEDPANPADKVDQGDRIESTGACYVITEGFGTAPWASEAYAGKLFTSHMYRYGGNDPKIYVAAVSANSFVQIKQDTDGDGDLDVVDFATIAKDDTHEFTVTLVDGRPFQVTSNQNINVYYVAQSGDGSYSRDARVLTPAANDIIGFSFYITSIFDNTNLNAYRNQSGQNFSGTLNINQFIDIGRALKSNLNDYATRVIADKPVSMLQIADQDGINASPSLPVSMLATHFGIPRDADYVGIIAPSSATVTVTKPDGSTVGPLALVKNAGTHANAPYAYQYTDGATISAGTRFECSTPCFMIYDDEGPGADKDETLMIGFIP